MKLDTVRVGYAEPKTAPIGYFTAVLSPDGWTYSQYTNPGAEKLKPVEVEEFSGFVRSLMHELSSQKELNKYFKKHGADTDAVTLSVRFDCALMIYLAHVTGYAITIYPHRKENA